MKCIFLPRNLQAVKCTGVFPVFLAKYQQMVCYATSLFAIYVRKEAMVEGKNI